MDKRLLFHGSPNKISGSYLLPSKAKDLGEKAENIHLGVYATDERNMAIAMALLKCKGVCAASISFKKDANGIIYVGWPEQEHIYLYTLPVQKFRKTPPLKHQFVSFAPVRPIKEEKLRVAACINVVRKANREEMQKWFVKYGDRMLEDLKRLLKQIEEAKKSTK